jgi:hypothetical protein
MQTFKVGSILVYAGEHQFIKNGGVIFLSVNFFITYLHYFLKYKYERILIFSYYYYLK